MVVVSHLNASMRNMLEQFVRSAQSAIMLLHDDPGADVIKVTITDKEANLVVRDMKLPEDIQVLKLQVTSYKRKGYQLQATCKSQVAGYELQGIP